MRITGIFILFFLAVRGFAQTPTVAASNITFSNIGCNQFDVSWTNGNGAFRVVFIRQGSSLTGVPVKDEFYSPDPVFGKGEAIFGYGDHYCVYRGTGNSVTITGTKKTTAYYVSVFEYNGASGTYDYLTSGAPSKSLTTENITAGFSISPTGQCLNGNSFSFSNSSTSTRSPLSYVWNFGDGNTSTQTNPTHNYNTYKIFKVRLIANAPGCADTTFRNDTVHPHPVVKFDLDPSKPKNDTVQCFFGNRFTFRNLTTLPDIGLPNSSMRYEWVMDNGYTATGYKADRSFPQPGNYCIKLIAISYQNCKDSTVRCYKVLPRAIDPSQVVFSDKSMCLSNNKFTFTNNSPKAVSSRWIFGDGGNDSIDAKSASHSYAKTGKYYVRLKSYDAGGCLDVLRDSVDVFSNTSVNFSGLNSWYCLNDPKVFLKPTPGKGEFFGTNIDKTDSSFTPATVGVFKIGYVYSKGNCRDTAWNTTEVFKRPSVYLGRDTIICTDKPLTLSVDPTYNSTWSTGQSGASIQVSKTGLYAVNSVDGNCNDRDTINIKAIATPKITHMRDTTLCGGSTLVFDLKAEMGTALWNDGNTEKDRIIGQTGYYKVMLSNKCGTVRDSFNLTVEETACVVFFPNSFTPNADLLNDVWQPYGKYQFIRMNVFNHWGEKMYTSTESPVWNGYSEGSLCLDGVYSIVFEYLMQDGNSMKKITKGIVVHLIR